MESYCIELFFNFPARGGFVNITPQVKETLSTLAILHAAGYGVT